MKAPRKDAWSDAELAILYEFVNAARCISTLVCLLPGRTPSAIWSKLSQLRAEAGITRLNMHYPSAAERLARAGSARLAEAIENEIYRPTDDRGKRDG